MVIGNQGQGYITSVSNEIELSLDGIIAQQLLSLDSLPLVREVNPVHVIELNVSKVSTLTSLNQGLSHYISALVRNAKLLRGQIYGGSSLIEDVSDIEPLRYRTTAISDIMARGFLDILSQQIVIGVSHESLAWQLYNIFKKLDPILLSLSASSPYRVENDKLIDTGMQSRRPLHYVNMFRNMPLSIWSFSSEISSMQEYFAHLQQVSDDLNARLPLPDTVQEAYSFLPFTRLEPHQVYWTIRPRPDHNDQNQPNSTNSALSLELRVMDISTTVERMQTINNFVIGLAYYLVYYGTEEIEAIVQVQDFPIGYDMLIKASQHGLDTEINGPNIRFYVDVLRDFATKGLGIQGYLQEAISLNQSINMILADGNDATLIRRASPTTPQDLRQYLADRLQYGEQVR